MRGSNSIQQANKKKVKGASSQYFGVTWFAERRKWMAKITINYETKFIGLFDKEEDAAVAYLKAAIKQYGKEIRLEDQKNLGLIGNN
jgi:hypothetical protein